MKKILITLILLVSFTVASQAQWNVRLSNSNAEDVLSGNYTPSNYAASTVINDPAVIIPDMMANISSDSLKLYNDKLVSFGTRHVLSDTVSDTWGIGATRRWIHEKFLEISAANENRLEVGYLDFNYSAASTCPTFTNVAHRNVMAVLPGTDDSDRSFLLVEAHMDSRCNGACDTACVAPGAEDNGSGTSLVIELARVMSKYSFEHSIVFTTTTGEELGLWGGRAWAFYIDSMGMDFKACLNNDVVGGILCGPTASAPACSPPGEIDSTSLKVFSFSQSNNRAANSIHKQLARYSKLQLLETINPIASVPMNMHVYIYHDRIGRGGDHQPFSALNLRALRFTASNEHGNGSGASGHLQHTINDTLLDFNYLARNTMINGTNLALLALGPDEPLNPLFQPIPDGIQIEMLDADTSYLSYRVAVRTLGGFADQYWDSVYTFTGTTTLIVDDLIDGETYYVSVMNVDADGVESLPSNEFTTLVNSIRETADTYGITLFQNYPNPAGESTTIRVEFDRKLSEVVELQIANITGAIIEKRLLPTDTVVYEWQLADQGLSSGYYTCTLLVAGKSVATRKMIFR